MATTKFIVEVHTELPLTTEQMKDAVWALQLKVKELEFNTKLSPGGNVIQRAFVKEPSDAV